MDGHHPSAQHAGTTQMQTNKTSADENTVVFNQHSAKPKGSVTNRQQFNQWPVKM